MSGTNPEFDDAKITEYLSQADNQAIDTLPYGVVRMNKSGKVTAYNRYEQELAGLSADDVLQKDFFTEVAPCTNNFMVRERFVEGWEAGKDLDEQLDYVFSYGMVKTKVRLRLIVAGDEGWLLVKTRA